MAHSGGGKGGAATPTPEGAQPPQIRVRPSLRLRLTLRGERVSAFHRTPGRFFLQPLPYWALGQVSPSCQLFSQVWSSNPLLLGERLWVLGSFQTESRSLGRGLSGACVAASSTCSDGDLLSFTQEFLEPALRGFSFLFFSEDVFHM